MLRCGVHLFRLSLQGPTASEIGFRSICASTISKSSRKISLFYPEVSVTLVLIGPSRPFVDSRGKGNVKLFGCVGEAANGFQLSLE